MGGADISRRRRWIWLLAAAAPAALHAAEPSDPAPRPAPVDAGLLEFLAEEPALDDDLGKALMTGDVDRAIERTAGRSKVVKDDGKEPQ